jgi:hypothetical protein
VRLECARFRPQLVDSLRELGSLGRLGRVDAVAELVPELGAPFRGPLELFPDVLDGSHHAG